MAVQAVTRAAETRAANEKGLDKSVFSPHVTNMHREKDALLPVVGYKPKPGYQQKSRESNTVESAKDYDHAQDYRRQDGRLFQEDQHGLEEKYMERSGRLSNSHEAR